MGGKIQIFTNFLHGVMINPDELFSLLCLYQKIILKKKIMQ